MKDILTGILVSTLFILGKHPLGGLSFADASEPSSVVSYTDSTGNEVKRLEFYDIPFELTFKPTEMYELAVLAIQSCSYLSGQTTGNLISDENFKIAKKKVYNFSNRTYRIVGRGWRLFDAERDGERGYTLVTRDGNTYGPYENQNGIPDIEVDALRSQRFAISPRGIDRFADIYYNILFHWFWVSLEGKVESAITAAEDLVYHCTR